MRFLIICLLTLVSFNVQAQGFSKAPTSSVGEVVIAGKTFKGGISSTGSTYIMRTSKKSGKEYKSYIGTPTGKTFEGKKVYWANKKGVKVYFFFSINESTGYPKRNYLTKD